MPKERAAARIEGLLKSRRVDGRAVYSKSAKASLIEACRQPGVSVAASALANGINANLLHKWIRESESKPRSANAEVSPTARERLSALLPVTLTEELSVIRGRGRPPKRMPVEAMTPSASVIELEYRCVHIMLRGCVDAKQLESVLGCIRRAT